MHNKTEIEGDNTEVEGSEKTGDQIVRSDSLFFFFREIDFRGRAKTKKNMRIVAQP